MLINSFTHRKTSAPRISTNPLHYTNEEINRESKYQMDKNKIKTERFQTYMGSDNMKTNFNQIYDNHYTSSNVIAATSFSQLNTNRKIVTARPTNTEPKKSSKYLYGKNSSVFYA